MDSPFSKAKADDYNRIVTLNNTQSLHVHCWDMMFAMFTMCITMHITLCTADSRLEINLPVRAAPLRSH